MGANHSTKIPTGPTGKNGSPENDHKVDQGRNPFNQNSDRSDREKRTTSKGGPVFSKLFRLDRTDPLSFGPKFPEILVEWIAPQFFGNFSGWTEPGADRTDPLSFEPKFPESLVEWIPGGVLPYITYTGMCRPTGSLF